MGWSSATGIMDEIIKAVKKNVPDVNTRKKIYKPIVLALESEDWDTQDECLDQDLAFDEVMRELHPNWFEDDEEEDD